MTALIGVSTEVSGGSAVSVVVEVVDEHVGDTDEQRQSSSWAGVDMSMMGEEESASSVGRASAFISIEHEKSER